MKKVLFLHGFFASGSCIPAQALRKALNGYAEVLSPDLPMNPQKAINFIIDVCTTKHPDIIVGNSNGSFLAQMVAPCVNTPALLGNPHFEMTKFLETRIGNHRYKSERMDGKMDFIIDQNLINAFASLELHQFDNCKEEFKDKIWGLFGENDTLAHYEPLFLEHYTHSYHFPGNHTPTAEEVALWYVPLIKKMCDTFL